jgi:ABC-type uncharacterized transport system permease subunit
MMNIVALINISFFQAALRMATPIAFASLGGMYNERAGVVNIGLEGIMLNSAFFAVYATYLTGSSFMGIIAGVASGLVLGTIFQPIQFDHSPQHQQHQEFHKYECQS